MIEFKMIGNWARVSRGLRRMAPSVRRGVIAGQKRIAKALIKKVKDHINNQDLGWAELASNTRSADSRVLVDSGAYYSAISLWNRGDSYYAGVPLSAKNYKGERIADYAAYHEVGTSNLPARPLWAPSFRGIGGKKALKKYVILSVWNEIKQLRAYGLEVTYRI